MRFVVTVQDDGRGRIFVPVPFDPDEVWSVKPRHRVGGTVNGHRVRAIIEKRDEHWALHVGPAWLRGCGVAAGDEVVVELAPEGPQRTDLAEDLADALAANPEAGAFFDGLAQFYRKAYVRWIESTKRRPDERARRIAQTIDLLTKGVKDYRRG